MLTFVRAGRFHLRRHHLARYYAGTVNDAEIEHFSRLASEWWDEQGECKPLHHMNPVRVKYIRDKLIETRQVDDGDFNVDTTKILSGLDVLDVGCGGGLLSESLARLGGRTLAVDPADSNIMIATLHASRDPRLSREVLEYRQTTAEDLLSQDSSMHGKFDVVCSLEVVEHVDNPSSFLKSLAALTKPGGHLFLSTIARTPLAYLLTILMAENVLKIVPSGTHSHSKFIRASEMITFFKDDIQWISRLYDGEPTRSEAEVRGLAYLPWMSKWYLLPRGAPGSLDCNYLFWARKPLT